MGEPNRIDPFMAVAVIALLGPPIFICLVHNIIVEIFTPSKPAVAD